MSLDLERIRGAFAGAAVDPSQWTAAMVAAAAATGSFGAAMFPIRGRLPNVPYSPSMTAAVEAYVRDGWVQRDERYRVTPIMCRRGVGSEFDFTTVDEIARHAYYQEFLAPFGLRWFAGVKVGSGDDLWCLSIQRTIEQGPFSPAELAQLAALSTQLSSAAALATALGFARAEAALDAFAVSGKAVALLDRCGEVWRLNGAAERMLGPDLQIARRRLVCADRHATAALDRALHDAIWSVDRPSLSSPVVLPRRNGHPVLAYPARLKGIAADAFAPCQVVVVLVDLEERGSIIERDLVQIFKLTRAEARLANRLLSGASLEEAANEGGIAYETVRNLLKRIMWKTGTHRQGQLISLLARLAAYAGNEFRDCE